MRFVASAGQPHPADVNGPESNDEKWPLRASEELVTIACNAELIY
jgi:hypothetical protein